MFKGFVTFRTLIWLLSSVAPLVSDKICLHYKSFVTFRTLIWLLFGVNLFVFYKITLCCKRFVTFRTLKWFLTSVRLLLCDAFCLHCKTFHFPKKKMDFPRSSVVHIKSNLTKNLVPQSTC
ncbi:unnamed protein product, partial [Staurois parvus]